MSENGRMSGWDAEDGEKSQSKSMANKVIAEKDLKLRRQRNKVSTSEEEEI